MKRGWQRSARPPDRCRSSMRTITTWGPKLSTPTASLEHYVFDSLIEHPCVLSNMRGLFSDVIADHVLGFVICFARNFHVYFRRQMLRTWEGVGGEAGRSDFISGP